MHMCVDHVQDKKPLLPSLTLHQPKFICSLKHILNSLQMTKSQANVIISFLGQKATVLPSGEVVYDRSIL